MNNLSENIKHDLLDMYRTFEAKTQEYGDSALTTIGEVLSAMFPEGIELTDHRDFTRFALLVQICIKVIRYSQNFHRGGHEDSLRDLGVYAAMLKGLDRS